MHRVDTAGNVANAFSDGTPGVTQATVVDQAILNAFQEELCNVVEALRTVLVKGTNTQLRDGLGIDLVGSAAMFQGPAVQGGSAGGRWRVVLKKDLGVHASEMWITLNAAWDPGAAHWNADGAGPCVALRFYSNDPVRPVSIGLLRCNDASPFATGAWKPYNDASAAALVEVQAAVAPALLNSWANKGGGRRAAGYYIDPFGRKQLQGSITGGINGSIAFTLPAYMWPSAIVYFPVTAGVAGSPLGIVSINTTGDVTIVDIGSGTNVALDSISYF